MVKLMTVLFFVFSAIFARGSSAVRLDYSLSDKKAIEKIAEDKSAFTDKNTKEFKIYLNSAISNNRFSSRNTEIVVSNVFSALKFAHEKDKLNDTSTNLFENALKISKAEKRSDLTIWVSLNYAFYFYTYRRYEKCFPLFMYCIAALDENNDEQIIQISETYKKIAYFLTTTNDHDKAEEFLKKALQYAKPETNDVAGILNNLGFCSLEKKNYAEAEYYFKKALSTAQKTADHVRYAKALGSLADLELKRQNYDKAIDLLQKDISISKKHESDQNTMFALNLLSNVYFEKGDIKNAERYLDEAKKYATSKSHFRSFEYQINETILKIAKMKGDDQQELIARRRLEKLKDSLMDFDAKETVLRVGWESQKKQLQLKLAKDKAELEKESYLKISAITVACILLILMVFIIRSYRHKMRSKKGEYDKKVLTLMIDKIKSESKLNNTHKTLQSYQTYLSEKNKQIEELEKEMQKVKNSSFSELEERSGDLQKLLESHLMTDENWKNFRNAFIQKYPTHYKELTNQFPDLTDSNLRIIILTKLNMNNTEISRLLGVTIDAVKKAKHRLRKKYENDHESLFEQI
ncbi:tetratricopeptide repeat protein [Chryseobacterium caseinilyticum]|uniref:Tetratricopeptide repeat protein n=1 Tax=Chryseobacterium caseinilyticum TaxID=2771428 RepID=A0ABR8ZE29_9FLAO|nr:tetratricopeptide repeat protein [Chryseobacterium caseinilyticum]MBD8083540.1 tetratricopeptide repeat protein [Chryseobacterium caseinilyticum]